PIGQSPVASAAVSGQTVTLTVDNHGNGLTNVDWGDGTSSSGPAIDGGTVDHTYAADGTYQITVTSVSNPLATTTLAVTIGAATGLVASVDALDSDASGMTVNVTWNNAYEASMTVTMTRDTDEPLTRQPAARSAANVRTALRH